MNQDSAISLAQPALIAAPDIHAVIRTALQIVIKAWIQICREKLVTVEHRTSERRTAGRLYQRMVRAEQERTPRTPWVRIKAEVATFSSDELEVPDGWIDMEIVHNFSGEPDLRLECKRVSTTPADGPRDRAAYYIGDGVLRFVGDKYGRGHAWGVMLAFVIDGKSAAAASFMAARIAGYTKAPLHVCAPWAPEDRFGRSRHLFRTAHLQGGGPSRIQLLHLFLPFPPSASRPSCPSRVCGGT
ncbi:MAG: hypothetical protein FJ290_01040 [Planctomycetes bacterium]|nr:hypothetical protein [Planctomycetota bacterium]